MLRTASSLGGSVILNKWKRNNDARIYSYSAMRRGEMKTGSLDGCPNIGMTPQPLVLEPPRLTASCSPKYWSVTAPDQLYYCCIEHFTKYISCSLRQLALTRDLPHPRPIEQTTIAIDRRVDWLVLRGTTDCTWMNNSSLKVRKNNANNISRQYKPVYPLNRSLS